MLKRFLLLVFLSVYFCYGEPFLPSSFLHQPFYFEAETLIADFDSKVRDGEFEAAARAMQEGIDKSGSLVVNNKNFEFSSARAFFTEKLLKADAKTLAAYRMLADPRAEELYNKAVAASEKQDFKKILDIYGASSYAGKARQYLADHCLAEGDFDGALQNLRALKTVTAQGLLKAAFCLEKLEREKEAVEAYKELENKFKNEEIEVEGVKVMAGAFALEKLNSLSGPKKLPEPLFKSGKIALKWEGLSLPENPFEVSEPVISAGKVLLAVDRTFYALEPDWGHTVFQSSYFEFKNTVEAGSFPALCGPGVAADGELAAVRYFTTKIAYSVYDLEKKETQLYLTPEQLGAEKGKYSSSLNLPAVKDNAVFIGLLSTKDKFSQCYLLKMGRGKSEIKWSVFLGSGNQSEFLLENAPAPVISGGDIFVETNLFTLACVDRELGILKWILGLPPETELGNDERLSENNPPYKNMLVDGASVYYAPKHRKKILAIEKAAGRKLWEISRNYFEYLVGEKGENIFTADTANIYKIDKKSGKRSFIFRSVDNGNTGKVVYYKGYFYFPASRGVGMVDLDGQNFVRYPLAYFVNRVFPFEKGLLIYGERKLHLYADREETAASAKRIKENTPEYIPASYCLALLSCFDGKIEEGKALLKKLLALGEFAGKEVIKARLESLEFEEAQAAFLAGDLKTSREILEKLESAGDYQARVAWLLLQVLEKEGEKAGINGYYEKIIKEGKGKYFEPEPGLELAEDYYGRVKLQRTKEYFPPEAGPGKSNVELASKPLWETKRISATGYVRPFLLHNNLYFAGTSGFSKLELETGKLAGEPLKAKKKPPEAGFVRYGFYPESSAGDDAMIYFCMPNNSIFGIEPGSRALNFEWYPEKKISQNFLPESLAVTAGLLVLYDPFSGLLALERKSTLKAYEIKGEYSRPCFYNEFILAVEKRTMILKCFEAATGLKKWELNLQAGMQNLEIKCDATFIYIILEEGVIYKIKQSSGYQLLVKKLKSDSGGWDFYPAAMSLDSIFINAGRYIYCIEKELLEIRWKRDTFSAYRNEAKPAPKKGQFEIGKPVLVQKPAERQIDVSWLYLLGSRLLARTGEFIEVYDTETGKPELWLEKAFQLASKDNFSPLDCYYCNNNLVIVNNGTAVCFSGTQTPGEQDRKTGKNKKK